MADSPRKEDLRIAYPSSGNQSDYATAQSNGAIDTLFNLDETDPQIEIVTTDDKILDCTGDYDANEITRARSSRVSFGVYFEAVSIFRLLSLGFGVVSGDDATLLAPGSYQPPPISFIVGHLSGAVSPLKFKGMVLDTLRITAPLIGRVKAAVQFRGHGGPSTTTYTFPDCATAAPVYLNDGALSLNSVDRLADCTELDFLFDNKLYFQSDPFTFADIEAHRMERGSGPQKREYPLSVKLYGEEGDSTFNAALAKSKWPYSFQIGPSSGGIQIATTSDAILALNGSPTHEGEARRSTLPIQLRARRAGGDSSPITATYLHA